jgi:FAD/FMN-containing dehydrogenase
LASRRYTSWGLYPRGGQDAVRPNWRHLPLPLADGEARTLLPYGNGRSYGDSCLNHGGLLLDMRRLDRFIDFDAATGMLTCEAGVLLADILDLVVPRGWMLPVVPGTKFITVGGAIANDVHGKNHHRRGTFGCHVERFELLRSDGRRLLCSREQNPDWFRHTIGGLGLTGVILWCEIKLQPRSGPNLLREVIRFGNIDEFLTLSRDSDRDYEYSVAWIDATATGSAFGRGLFERCNPVDGADPARLTRRPMFRFNVPCALPFSPMMPFLVRSFNAVYHLNRGRRLISAVQHFDQVLFPLDGIENWNRLYGRRGFLQHQSVVPDRDGAPTVRELLVRVAGAGCGSFLAVLKSFGNVTSPGTLSFPRPGITLALDFPYRGRRTLALLDELDSIVVAAGGAVYPAKDARMSADSFRQFFPQWHGFRDYVDERFSSGFWRRVSAS